MSARLCASSLLILESARKELYLASVVSSASVQTQAPRLKACPLCTRRRKSPMPPLMHSEAQKSFRVLLVSGLSHQWAGLRCLSGLQLPPMFVYEDDGAWGSRCDTESDKLSHSRGCWPSLLSQNLTTMSMHAFFLEMRESTWMFKQCTDEHLQRHAVRISRRMQSACFQNVSSVLYYRKMSRGAVRCTGTSSS